MAWHYVQQHGESMLVGLAAATGIVLFVQGSLQLRRRPEAAVEWAWAPPGDAVVFDDHTWTAGAVLVLPPEMAVVVRISMENIGDQSADNCLFNFALPQSFGLASNYGTEGNHGLSTPHTGPATLIAQGFQWMAGAFQVNSMTITSPAEEGDYNAYFEVAAERLNSTGHRRSWRRGWTPAWSAIAGHVATRRS